MIRSMMRARTQDSLSAAFGDLLLRAFAGLTMAFAHGWGKLPPSDNLIAGVEGVGFPLPEFFAWCAALGEFGGGLLLALGLFTRPGAALMAITMAVAAFAVHAADPFQRKELALLYLAVALYYLFSGAGRISLDAVLIRPTKSARGTK